MLSLYLLSAQIMTVDNACLYVPDLKVTKNGGVGGGSLKLSMFLFFLYWNINLTLNMIDMTLNRVSKTSKTSYKCNN